MLPRGSPQKVDASRTSCRAEGSVGIAEEDEVRRLVVDVELHERIGVSATSRARVIDGVDVEAGGALPEAQPGIPCGAEALGELLLKALVVDVEVAVDRGGDDHAVDLRLSC